MPHAKYKIFFNVKGFYGWVRGVFCDHKRLSFHEWLCEKRGENEYKSSQEKNF